MSNKSPLDSFYKDCLRIGSIKVRESQRYCFLVSLLQILIIVILGPHVFIFNTVLYSFRSVLERPWGACCYNIHRSPQCYKLSNVPRNEHRVRPIWLFLLHTMILLHAKRVCFLDSSKYMGEMFVPYTNEHPITTFQYSNLMQRLKCISASKPRYKRNGC